MHIPGLDIDFYYGYAGAPPPDWRKYVGEPGTEEEDDEDEGTLEIGQATVVTDVPPDNRPIDMLRPT